MPELVLHLQWVTLPDLVDRDDFTVRLLDLLQLTKSTRSGTLRQQYWKQNAHLVELRLTFVLGGELVANHIWIRRDKLLSSKGYIVRLHLRSITIKQDPGKSLSVTMASIVSRSRLSKTFEHDPGVDLEYYDSDVINCGPLTISDYGNLERRVNEAKESIERITDEERINGIKFYSQILLLRNKCYFFPATSWTGQDVKDWFALIGFAAVDPAPEFDNQLSGELLLNLNASKLFTEGNWTLLEKKYEAYCEGLKLKAECPQLLIKKLRSYSSMRNLLV